MPSPGRAKAAPRLPGDARRATFLQFPDASSIASEEIWLGSLPGLAWARVSIHVSWLAFSSRRRSPSSAAACGSGVAARGAPSVPSVVRELWSCTAWSSPLDVEFTGFSGLGESLGVSGKSVGWSHDGGFLGIAHWGAPPVGGTFRPWPLSWGYPRPGSVWSMGSLDRPRWLPVGPNTSLRAG